MRALFERSLSARAAVVLLALGAVLGLADAATAENDFGFRHDTLWPELRPTAPAVASPTAAPVHHRHARRIWAASRGRPLRVALSRVMRARPRNPARFQEEARQDCAGFPAPSCSARRRHRTRIAERRRVLPRAALVRLRAIPEPQVVFPKLIVLPTPPRPALVTLYQDRTLRDGDAVMMADGIHVFHGAGEWPHRPRDFVRLTFVAALDWHLRQTLGVLDRNPPTRWSSIGSAAG